jgi:hypothetical protein
LKLKNKYFLITFTILSLSSLSVAIIILNGFNNFLINFFYILPWVIILGILLIILGFLITNIIIKLEWKILEFQIEQKYCNQCGTKLSESKNYCPNCKTNLSILEIVFE